jgi:hypothetical protein
MFNKSLDMCGCEKSRSYADERLIRQMMNKILEMSISVYEHLKLTINVRNVELPSRCVEMDQAAIGI